MSIKDGEIYPYVMGTTKCFSGVEELVNNLISTNLLVMSKVSWFPDIENTQSPNWI